MMSTFSRRSSDVSYYNGPTPNISGCENVFVCTLRCNQGEVAVTTYAQTQTGWVAQHLGFSSEYVFNGPFDAYTVGVTFAQHCLFAFVVGKSGILIDCEDEGATNTHAWGSTEAIEFASGVRAVRPDIPWSAFFVYHNYTVNRRFNWQPCVDLGMGLVYARPDSNGGTTAPDDYLYWPNPFDRYIKQAGTVNGLDADWHNTPWAQIIASTPTSTPLEAEMALIKFLDDPGQPVFLFTPKRVKHMGTLEEGNLVANAESLTPHEYHHDDCQRAIYAYLGNPAPAYADVLELSITRKPDGSVANYNKGGEWVPPAVAITEQQVTSMATAVVQGVTAALPAGVTPDQLEAAVKAGLTSLTLKAA